MWFKVASGMAKKSLKKRIDTLVDAIGAAEKPSLVISSTEGLRDA